MTEPSRVRDRRRLLASVVALVALLLVCSAGTVTAFAARERVAQARKQYLGQEYERVLRLLTPLVQSPATTIAEKVEAYELLGLSYLILGDSKRAREAFENLLGIDPGHVLRDPSGSPKLRLFFDSVKERFVPGYKVRAPVNVEHGAPVAALAGRRVEFNALIVQGGKEVGQVMVRWRRAGLLTFQTELMTRRGGELNASFVLPPDAAAYQLEYYIEVRDRTGQSLTRTGSPERPLVVAVAGAPLRSESVLRKWWFWTAVGAAVVAGVTVGVVVGAGGSPPEGNLTPGVIRLRLR